MNGGTPPYQYLWSNNETDTIIQNILAGNYSITVTDDMGCNYQENIAVSNVYSICLVPANVLTPNGDGKNDTWQIKFIDLIPEARVRVYNKTGLLVFDKTAYQSDWAGQYKGKDLPTGSYLYIIELDNASEPVIGYLDIIR